jgi:hypothetical protein
MSEEQSPGTAGRELAGEPGDSLEQREAETAMVNLLAEQIGLDLKPERIKLPEGGWLQVDGFSQDPRVACEAWAHHGEAKSALKDKVAKDIFKLVFVRELMQADTRLILLFSDEAATKFLRGRSWRAQAMRSLGVEIEVVDVPVEVRNRIIAAQKRQYR